MIPVMSVKATSVLFRDLSEGTFEYHPNLTNVLIYCVLYMLGLQVLISNNEHNFKLLYGTSVNHLPS